MKVIMFCHKKYIFLLFLSIISFFVQCIEGYCYGSPRFTGSPVVTEFQSNELRVSWKGIVYQRDCIDQFWVKYWEKSKPIAYKMSHLAGKDTNFIDIKVSPDTEYIFEVITRGGLRYLRSPTVDFRTRQTNGSNVTPENNDDIKTGKFYQE